MNSITSAQFRSQPLHTEAATMEDPFENMREQMERDRDQFFKTVPREWPSEGGSSRGGMFNMVRQVS